MSPDELAQRFHEAYERLAPSFGYETRRESAVPWAQVPENNRRLMTATVLEAVRPLMDRIREMEDEIGRLRSWELAGRRVLGTLAGVASAEMEAEDG